MDDTTPVAGRVRAGHRDGTSNPAEPTEPASAEHGTGLLQHQLEWAAGHFGLAFLGAPVVGRRLRSAGAQVIDAAGERWWLRVATTAPGGRQAPSGTAPPAMPVAVPGPVLREWHTWPGSDDRTQFRAEVQTLLPGTPCSPNPLLSAEQPPPSLSENWWHDLDAALRRISTVPTERAALAEATVRDRVHQAFSGTVTAPVYRWETAHGNLHWGNLLTEPLGILGWEQWGRAPVGTDAATLYCYSLTVPEVAAEVWTQLPVLETADGRTALLSVTADLVQRTAAGAYPELFAPVRNLAGRLLTT